MTTATQTVTPAECRPFVEPTLARKMQWGQRASNLATFCNAQGVRPEDVTIVENNTWSHPPTPSRWRAKCLLGGTTYQYQVWAVLPKR